MYIYTKHDFIPSLKMNHKNNSELDRKYLIPNHHFYLSSVPKTNPPIAGFTPDGSLNKHPLTAVVKNTCNHTQNEMIIYLQP